MFGGAPRRKFFLDTAPKKRYICAAKPRKIKMRYTKQLVIFAAMAIAVSSCGKKDEPANVEAEIVSFNIDKSMQRSCDVGNGFVNVFVRKTEGPYMEATPTIEVSKGASIAPASGQMVRFERSTTDTSEYVAHYTITSENGQSVKDYKVTLIPPIRNYLFSFDKWTLSETGSASYYLPEDTKWATGNAAVAIYMGKDPSKYPASYTDVAVSGRAAKLQTVMGATFAGVPIAAGNLFWGNFKTDNIFGDKLTFTRFGQPFDQKPKTLKGHYQYKSGEKFTDKNNNEVDGRVDSCFIYAIFFESDEGGTTLDGHNIQTSDRIVAKALMPSVSTVGSSYTPFSIPFVYDPAKEAQIDFVNKYYRLAIVFTSSKSGGTFEGAIGSTLLVDEVTLECYEEN